MTDAQKKVQSLILANVKDGKKDDAEKLLKQVFKKHEEGELDALYLATNFAPKMLSMVDEDKLDKVKDLVMDLKKKLDD